MKKEYVEIVKWVVENEDGTKHDITVGDKVRITYDQSQNLFSDFFLKYYPSTTLDGFVTDIKKTKIVINVYPSWYLTFYPKQIVRLAKID